MVPNHPPLQIVHIGNGCEGYSPSLFIPAKADQAVTEEIEPHRDYFLELNDIYTPGEYIGIWYEFCTILMDWEDAQKLVERVEPLGTLDFSILNKHIRPIPVQKGGGFPVPPMVLVVGVRVCFGNNIWNPVCM